MADDLEVITIDDLMHKYQIIDTSGEAIIVTDKEDQERTQLGELTYAQSREIGSTAPSGYNSFIRQDYNPELRGLQGLRRYDQMRRSDAQVRMSLRFQKTPLIAGRWFIEPFSDKKEDKDIAKFIWDNLTKWMSVSWPQFMLEALNMLDFGFYCFEKVRDVRPKSDNFDSGMIYWKKFAARHPLDLYQWDYDKNGGPNAAVFYNYTGLPYAKIIPIEKLLVFTYDKEGGNMNGTSVLRPAYKHWFFKDTLYRIDAIQKERHGIGIPIIKLPPGFTPKDKAVANDLGRNLRTNERAHITLPPGWDLTFADLQGNPVDAMLSIDHHDKMIARNVMLQEGPDDDKLFLKNARFIAEIVRDVINKWAIPELVQWNWGKEDCPELRVRRIGDTVDWRAMSFAVRNFVGAGILRPDDPLEDWVRDEMDLPKADPKTMREADTPQVIERGLTSQIAPQGQQVGGAQAVNTTTQQAGKPATNQSGVPKQSLAKNMKVDTGSSKVGQDGGKAK